MVKKFIAILLILMTVIFIISPMPVFAGEEDEEKEKKSVMDIDYALKRADNFVQSGEPPITTKEINEVMNPMYNICLVIGIVISVIIGAILGIKFITGSVDQKADVKKLLIPYIAGCVLIFGAFGIWRLAVEILDAI